MRKTTLLVLVTSTSLGCASAIPPRQPDGQDCNYAEAATACGATSYCDPGEAVGNRGYARSRTYGLLRDKTHVVGTCRPKGAAGAECRSAATCVSGRCMSPTPGFPGTCE